MTRFKSWQDAVIAVLGAWLVLSPWAVGYRADTPAMANAVILGLALIAVALGAVFAPSAWEKWTEGAFGAWLIASPWLLRFGDQAPAMRTAVLTGVAVVVLALWTLATDKEHGGFRKDRIAH